MSTVHAYIEVTDLQRGIEFYCGGLGLTQKRSAPALRRTALLGDGWMPIGLRPQSLLDPEQMADKIARLRVLLSENKRAEGHPVIFLSLRALIDGTH